jgi:hypothetical protein
VLCAACCLQYCGVGSDLPLLGDNGWLSTYAFPTEVKYGFVYLLRAITDTKYVYGLGFGMVQHVLAVHLRLPRLYEGYIVLPLLCYDIVLVFLRL